MKNKIYFICSAKIDYNIDNLDIYDSFDLVSKGEREAELSKHADREILDKDFEFDIKKITLIYSAYSGQTYASAQKINKLLLGNNAKIKQTRLLNGIRFSMQQLISKQEFEHLKYEDAIKITRRRFVEKFFDDKLTEPRSVVLERMEKLVDLLESKKELNVLCIGHAFYLKILEAYIFDKNIFENKEKLLNFFNPNERPFDNLEGFSY